VDHGIVDENRQRKPSYEIWKTLNAAVRLEARWVGPAAAVPARFSATVIPNSQHDLPYRPLSNYELSWVLQDEQGNPIARGQQHFDRLTDPISIDQMLPTGTAPTATGLAFRRLVITLLAPSGFTAAERTLVWTQQH
jgi:beta-glucuronidase